MLTILVYLCAFFGLAGEPDGGLQNDIQPQPTPYIIVEPNPPSTDYDDGWYTVN